MLAATRSLATAAAGLTPRKISAGVIRAPPPMPVRPDDDADAEADDEHRERGGGEEVRHGTGLVAPGGRWRRRREEQ